MKQLPLWVLNEKFPNFYDMESKTVIEQTARVYGAMRSLIEEYNKMISDLNVNLEEFEQLFGTNYENFAMGLRQEFQDFINVIDLKVLAQDKYLRENMLEASKDVIDAYVLQFERIVADFNDMKAQLSIDMSNHTDNIDAKIETVNALISTMQQTITDHQAYVENMSTIITAEIQNNVQRVVTEYLNSGNISVGVTYNEENEALTIGTQTE